MQHQAASTKFVSAFYTQFKRGKDTTTNCTAHGLHTHSSKIRSCKLKPILPFSASLVIINIAELTTHKQQFNLCSDTANSSKFKMRLKKDKPPSNEQNNIWTRAAIETLLGELRKRKTLYDQRHPDYLNRSKRQMCHESICKSLHDKLGIKVSVGHLKNKIQVLRAQFNKDLRCMLSSKKYKPKFWCFKKMEWIKPYCNNRYNASSNSATSKTTASAIEAAPSTNGNEQQQENDESFQPQDDPRLPNHQSDMTSTTTLEEDAAMSSSNILTSKMVEAVLEEPNNDHDMEDINDQFYETIALTQQIVQNRVAAKELRAENCSKSKTQSTWEGELVKSQLDLISDETIRADTMWEIQCVLRRGIEQDRVLPKRRRKKNRQLSLANSEVSANGSYISLDSNDSIEGMNNGNGA